MLSLSTPKLISIDAHKEEKKKNKINENSTTTNEALELDSSIEKKSKKEKKKDKKNSSVLDKLNFRDSEDKKKSKKDKKRKASEINDDDEEDRSETSSELMESINLKVKKKKKRTKRMEPDDEQEAEEEENPNAVTNFRISEPLRNALKSKGIRALFPIQAMTFDTILDGADLVGRARTGQILYRCKIPKMVWWACMNTKGEGETGNWKPPNLHTSKAP